eukprot:13040689-Heterocapsa_arctica.AAC.1
MEGGVGTTPLMSVRFSARPQSRMRFAPVQLFRFASVVHRRDQLGSGMPNLLQVQIQYIGSTDNRWDEGSFSWSWGPALQADQTNLRRP